MASAAARNEVTGGQAPAQQVVTAHRAMHLLVAVAAPDDQRLVILRHPLDGFELVRLADHQHTVEHARFDNPVQPVGIAGDHAAEHQVMPAFGQFIGQMAQQGHEKRIGNVLTAFVAQRDHHADHPGFLRAQPPCHLVGAEAMFARYGLDAFARFLVDQIHIGQRARDGARRYPGDFRQFLDIANAAGPRFRCVRTVHVTHMSHSYALGAMAQ